MTYAFQKDNVKGCNLHKINEEYISLAENEDDQDIYISERSSIASSSDTNLIETPIKKKLPTPTPSPPLILPNKPKNMNRHHINNLGEHGLQNSTHIQFQIKEEKKKKQVIRKNPPNNRVGPPPYDTKISDVSDNYYPYWQNHRGKVSERTNRHRQPLDIPFIARETLDSSYNSQPVLTTSSIKPKHQLRKSRKNGASIIQPVSDKYRHEVVDKSSLISSNSTFNENYEREHQLHRSSPKQQTGLKLGEIIEHRENSSNRTISQQRRKVKVEGDWTNHHSQSFTSKSPQDLNSLIVTSNVLGSRSKNRSKAVEKNFLSSDGEDNSHVRQNQSHTQNHHVRRRPPSGVQINPELQAVDVAVKKADRSPYFQHVRDTFYSPTPSIHNPSPHLPPIMRDHHHQNSHNHKIHTTRFPREYYGTLARQTYAKDWDENADMHKFYKHEQQSRLYDRYLNTTVIDKRLAA